ncbi:MAG: hypothetical protein J7647_10585 [Cyanobacteria bacterium SBLK]|nr:hypothetical protein [Cyanobacteria bacterium SBLK]
MRKLLAIFVLSLAVVILPYVAWAKSYDQVSQIAKDITVLIDGCSAGSGVIYERTKNVYSVLTAGHCDKRIAFFPANENGIGREGLLLDFPSGILENNRDRAGLNEAVILAHQLRFCHEDGFFREGDGLHWCQLKGTGGKRKEWEKTEGRRKNRRK